MEVEILTEVPSSLKLLVRYVVKGFYGKEHAIVMDLLIVHPCVKEDDILELLKFERKQLRAVINTLKTDKFLKARMRVETDGDGKMTRHNYYFINYSLFVNVVKYKLDHMRRKIETEQRDSANRASYICPTCQKTFTDLEADQLVDMMSGEFLCTYCKTEVEEQVSDEPRTDSKSLLVKFNEQLEPLFSLLKEVEDIRLSHSILEPEPTDIKSIRPASKAAAGAGVGERGVWSGELSRKLEYGMLQNEVTVSMDGDATSAGNDEDAKLPAKKERPVWMMESTIEGAATEDNTKDSTSGGFGGAVPEPAATTAASSKASEDIMRTLLAHEKKSSDTPQVAGVPASDEEGATSSSDSEDDTAMDAFGKPQQLDFLTAAATVPAPSVTTMDSEDDEDEVAMVTVAGQQLAYDQVTPDLVAQMTQQEKDHYIRIGQEMYNDLYD